MIGATVIDLCAGGAGGWEYAARELGLDPLGIELDDAACAVRHAAGLRTLQADISALDPLDFAPCDGLVGGVPCPSFSMAGKGVGRAAIPFFVEAIGRMGRGESIDVAELDEACADATAHLILEPLRWTLALRPRWIAQEQVEPVLPLWEATATVLRVHGYWAWCGVVSSETFGTPQTRRRALLLASLDGPVSAPVATHARYVAPRRNGHEAGLFDLPEPERIVLPEDRGLLPWRSMAQALGWGLTARPSTSVVCSSEGGGSPEARCMDGGSGTRRAIAESRERGEWQLRANANANANACVRDVDEPAPTITAGHDSGERVWVVGQKRSSGPGADRPPRGIGEPSYTLRVGAGGASNGTGQTGGVEWVTAPTHYDRRQQSGGEPVPLIDVDRPAPTLGAEGLAKGRDVWVTARPATTVNADPRISEPGHHDSEVSGSQQANAVRVTIAEAAALQGFPDGHPWMAAGSKTAAYRCVGNAIPPQMALAALLAVRAGSCAQADGRRAA